jgi:hypothetical protein
MTLTDTRFPVHFSSSSNDSLAGPSREQLPPGILKADEAVIEALGELIFPLTCGKHDLKARRTPSGRLEVLESSFWLEHFPSEASHGERVWF